MRNNATKGHGRGSHVVPDHCGAGNDVREGCPVNGPVPERGPTGARLGAPVRTSAQAPVRTSTQTPVRTSVGVPAAVPTLRRLPVPDAGPGPDRTAPPGSRTAARTGPPSGPEPEPPGPEPEPPGPEHRRWVSGFVLAAFEVTAGVRPSGQLVRWCTDDVRSTLRRQLALETSGGQVPDRRPGFPGARVLSVRSSAPDDGHVESAVTVAIGTRVRAVALRTEPLGGRWRVTALEIG
jgi:hypothetical protein